MSPTCSSLHLYEFTQIFGQTALGGTRVDNDRADDKGHVIPGGVPYMSKGASFSTLDHYVATFSIADTCSIRSMASGLGLRTGNDAIQNHRRALCLSALGCCCSAGAWVES